MRILLVEDNVLLGEGLQDSLADEGETVDWMKTGREALLALKSEPFDLIILDLGLPDLDGLEVLRKLRGQESGLQQNRQTPVLILTARDQTADRVKGLDQGADDYLVKPFERDELLARTRALHRRATGRSQPILDFERLVIVPSERRVTLDGNDINLSRREYAVLLALAESPGRYLSKQQISEKIYGWGEEVESNALEVHIHHLRKKLEGNYIVNRRGLGYRFATDSAKSSDGN